MKSVAVLSLAALCFFYATPIESAHWGYSQVGYKMYLAAPSNVKFNWWNAHKACRQLGLELASIDSQAESDAASVLLLDLGNRVNNYYWTSGSDIGRTANNFSWFSNGRPVKVHTNWFPGDPSNGANEDYIFIGHQGEGSTAKYVWNDHLQTLEASPLCEMDLTSIVPGFGDEPTYFVESNLKLNWYEAARACRQRGMRLASIESQSDADKFTAAVRAFGFTEETNYWTSGTDNGQAVNSFYWFSTGNPISFGAWRTGEPNNNAGNGVVENCLTVRVPTTGAASWNDWTCDGELSFVCEIRV